MQCVMSWCSQYPRKVDRNTPEHNPGSLDLGLPLEVVAACPVKLHVPQYPDVPFLAPTTVLSVTLHEHFRQVHNRSRVFG
jgi:hypothetical protein